MVVRGDIRVDEKQRQRGKGNDERGDEECRIGKPLKVCENVSCGVYVVVVVVDGVYVVVVVDVVYIVVIIAVVVVVRESGQIGERAEPRRQRLSRFSFSRRSLVDLKSFFLTPFLTPF